MYDLLQNLNFGNVHIFNDKELNFTAIIAINSLKNGSAIGGCRCLVYENLESAIVDAINLAHAMSNKSMLHDLPFGGAKSVIFLSKKTINKEQIMKKFGEFVDSLNGQYIAAVDSGTSPSDMENIAKTTKYVLADSTVGDICNPSVYTAQGVFNSILGANSYLYNNNSIRNKKFLIQGVGAVGMILAEKIHSLGGELFITDTNPDVLEIAKNKFNAKIVTSLVNNQYDYFVPCALGGVLTKEICKNIQTKTIIGAANNQFPHPFAYYEILQNRNIYWVPDYLCNGGGLIHVVQQYQKLTADFTDTKIANIKQKTIDFLTLVDQNSYLSPKEILNAIN
jgi:leucine dehydrogenase